MSVKPKCSYTYPSPAIPWDVGSYVYVMIFYCRKPVDEVKTTVGSERRGSQPIRGHYPGDVTTLDQSERRGSVPNMERMRLARRRKSIPAYLGKSRKRSFPYLSVHILILSPNKSTLGFREAFTKKRTIWNFP